MSEIYFQLLYIVVSEMVFYIPAHICAQKKHQFKNDKKFKPIKLVESHGIQIRGWEHKRLSSLVRHRLPLFYN